MQCQEDVVQMNVTKVSRPVCDLALQQGKEGAMLETWGELVIHSGLSKLCSCNPIAFGIHARDVESSPARATAA